MPADPVEMLRDKPTTSNTTSDKPLTAMIN